MKKPEPRDLMDEVVVTAKRVRAKAGRVAARAGKASGDRISRGRRGPVDLSKMPAEAKLLYCRILLRQANRDRILDPREISNLYLFAAAISLPAESRAALLPEMTAEPSDTGDVAGDETDSDAIALTRQLSESLDEPQRVPVLTMLVKDLLRISRADKRFAAEERSRISAIAAAVFPDTADAVIRETERLLATEEEFATGKITAKVLKQRTKDIIAGAAAIGAPLPIVSLVGVPGLSAAGVTSALATLGFGGVLGLSAMVTGIGTVVLVGGIVYQGTHFLLDTSERGRTRRRRLLVVDVIKHLELAIADLTGDIASLTRRVQESRATTRRDKERQAMQRTDLNSFRLALADLQSRLELARMQGSASAS